MSIVTKKGDNGKTSLFYGGGVAKDHPRIELCGALDELSSFLGVAKSLLKDKKRRACIEDMQKDLIVIGSEAATSVRFLSRLKKNIQKRHIERLESCIDELEAVPAEKGGCFSLAGVNPVSGCLDVSRTIARRCERQAVGLFKKKQLKNRNILVYLNRLSDLLYLLARQSEDGC